MAESLRPVNQEAVRQIQAMKLSSTQPIEMLRFLARLGLTPLDMMKTLRVAFDLSLGSLKDLGYWYPDRSSVIVSDDEINSVLSDLIYSNHENSE